MIPFRFPTIAGRLPGGRPLGRRHEMVLIRAEWSKLVFITQLLTSGDSCGLAANSAGATHTRAKRGHRDGLPGDLPTVD